ncbi:TnsA endonuclease N-terminal domain-containing protein [Comamonas terrigena]|uniref:TnsA endonuclease N-terminal domain-containing protein n=1 Tax=Comamonas terrigena TaxID=32013 RepID=UPI00244A2537|nr:TnsA endonuclease N-terminal domain-containing protein [Comamonas terrigena]MDH1291442.1 TnsA endonuclease N-terminal domain-containing protein [Comamonas terrigena]
MARLASGAPVRTFRVKKRGVTGKVQLSEGGRLRSESTLERDLIITLDFHSDVRAVIEQPVRIDYEHEGQRRRFTPDVLAEFDAVGGHAPRIVLYEVKFHQELQERWGELRPRFKAATHYCRQRGWRFKLMTERQIRTPFLKNAQFLRGYLGIRDDPVTRGQLLYMFRALGPTTPQALLAAAYWDEQSQMKALPYLWQMVAERVVGVDLHQPLTMASTIWMD